MAADGVMESARCFQRPSVLEAMGAAAADPLLGGGARPIDAQPLIGERIRLRGPYGHWEAASCLDPDALTAAGRGQVLQAAVRTRSSASAF